MKRVNVTFAFSKDCPYNLDGTCTNKGTLSLSCGIGKSVPPSWCPLPTAENSGAQPAQTNNSAMLEDIKDDMSAVEFFVESEPDLIQKWSRIKNKINVLAQQSTNKPSVLAIKPANI